MKKLTGKRKTISAIPAAKKAKIEKKANVNKKPVQKNVSLNNEQEKPEQSGIVEEIAEDPEEFKFTRDRLRNDAKKLIENNKRQDVKEMYQAMIQNSKSKQKTLLKEDMASMMNYNFGVALKEADYLKSKPSFGFAYYYVKALRLKSECSNEGTIERITKIVKDVVHRKDTKLRELTNYKKLFTQSSKKTKNESIENSRFYKVVHTTVAMEGNKFKLDEVEQFLTTGETIPDRTPHDHNEVTDIASAIKFANETLINNSSPIDLETILGLHEKIMKTTEPDSCGKLRNEEVAVGPHVAPKHHVVPELMSKFIEYLNTKAKNLHPIEAAARVHQELVRIHPFVDGNGRIGRLLMNIVLQRNGYPALDIPVRSMGNYYHCLDMCDDGYFEIFIEFLADCAGRVFDEYRTCSKK